MPQPRPPRRRSNAKYTEALAGELARETAASADEIEPWIVAHALIGLHQTVVDYSRRLILAGTRNPSLACRVRKHSEEAIELLARGTNDYGSSATRAPLR